MSTLVAASLGVLIGGGWGGLLAVLVASAWRHRPVRRREPPIRPVLLLLLVELRSGSSVLAALQEVSRRFPGHVELASAVRIGTVSGLVRAAGSADGAVKPLITQLARAQIVGSSAAESVKRMLESDLARERSDRLARARGLPVRLMIPLALLILPGVVLSAYGPALFALLDDLATPFG